MNECINKYRKLTFTLKYSHKYSYSLNFQKREAKCSRIEEQINKLQVVHRYIGMLLSSKNKELPMHPTIWMNFNCIMLSERSHSQMVIYELVNFYNIAKAKLQGEKNQGCQC